MKLNLTPTLENYKILVRPLENDDYAELFKIAQQPILWENHPISGYSDVEFKRFFKNAINMGSLLIIDKLDNRVIGCTQFYDHNTTESSIVIGNTFISSEYWGTGYNKMIKTLMLDYVFNFVEKVIFYVSENNIRSQKAIEKLHVINNGMLIRHYGVRTIKCILYTIEKKSYLN